MVTIGGEGAEDGAEDGAEEVAAGDCIGMRGQTIQTDEGSKGMVANRCECAEVS